MQTIPDLTAKPASIVNQGVDDNYMLKDEEDIDIKTETDNIEITNHIINYQVDSNSDTECKPDFMEETENPEDADTFRCVYCDFASPILDVFVHHVKTEHFADSGFETRPCQDDPSLRNAEVNINGVANNDLQPVICTEAINNLDLQIDTLAVIKKEVEVYECKECSFISEDERSFNQHIKNKHDWHREIYKCGSCKYSTTSKIYFSQHLKNHHKSSSNVDLLTVRVKSVEDNNNKSVTYHKARHPPLNSIKNNSKDIDDKYKCNICNYATKYIHGLHFHLRTTHIEQYTSNACRDCQNTFGDVNELINHIRNEHRQAVFQCSKCNYVCNDNRAMDMHKKVVHAKLHKCQFCTYITNKKSDLLRHNSMHDSTVYNCNLCSLQTKHLVYLSRHMKRVHASNSNTSVIGNMKSSELEKCKYSGNERVNKNQCNVTSRDKESVAVVDAYKSNASNYTATNKNDVSEHINTHQDSVVPQDSCRLCTFNDDLLTLLDLHMHEKIHEPDIVEDTCVSEQSTVQCEHISTLEQENKDVTFQTYESKDSSESYGKNKHPVEHIPSIDTKVLEEDELPTFLDLQMIKTLEKKHEVDIVEHACFIEQRTMQCDEISTFKEEKKDITIQTYDSKYCNDFYEENTLLVESIPSMQTKLLEGDGESIKMKNECQENAIHNCTGCDYISGKEGTCIRHVQNKDCSEDRLNGNVNTEVPKNIPENNWYSNYIQNVCEENKANNCTQCANTTGDVTKFNEHLHDSASIKDNLNTVNDNGTQISKNAKGKDTRKRYKCTVCNYISTKRIVLSRHMKKCDPSFTKSSFKLKTLQTNDNRISTKSLTSKYLKQYRYNTRRYSESTKVEMHKCNYCDFKCRRKLMLKTHITTVHNSVPKKPSRHERALDSQSLQCKLCSYKSTSKYQLTKHVAIRHDSNTPIYKCLNCDWTTKWKYYLTYHIKTVHPKKYKTTQRRTQKPISQYGTHKCPMCYYSTNYKPELFKHASEDHILNTIRSPDSTHGNNDGSYKRNLSSDLGRDNENRSYKIVCSSRPTNDIYDQSDIPSDSDSSSKETLSQQPVISVLSSKDGDSEEMKCPLCGYNTGDKIWFNKHISQHVLS